MARLNNVTINQNNMKTQVQKRNTALAIYIASITLVMITYTTVTLTQYL